jgi:4-amino-4-deoxy-L-arabinose transferase-like glycosyltransferase
MISRLAARAVQLRPAILIGLIIGLEALLVLALSHLPWSLSSNYGTGLTDEYNKLGRMLAEGYGYRFTPQTGPTLMREPGFPLTIAALYTVFGRSVIVVRLANLVFAGLSAGLLSRLAARLSANRAAPLLAPLLFLLHPGILVGELRFGIELPIILLTLCFIYALDRALRVKRLTAYAGAGLLLGLTCAFRSTALLFPVFLPLLFFFAETPRPSIVTMVKRLGVIYVATLLVLSPWMVRNYLLVGTPVATASVAGVAAHAGQYICENLSFSNGFQSLDYEGADERAALARQQGYRFVESYDLFFYDPHDEVAFSNWLSKRVMDKYRQSPLLFAECGAQNAFNYWFAGKNWTATLLNMGVQLPYMLLAIWSCSVYSRSRGWAPIGLYLLLCAYSMLVCLPIHAQARYSIPSVPFLALFIAAGIGEWRAARRDGVPAGSPGFA